jgi:hemerythrin superfamily protein
MVMNIFEYIQKDHRKVSELFEQLLAAHAGHRKKSLFEEIKEELLVHAKSEHDTFYKALEKSAELKEKLTHADKEHKEIEEYLMQLTDISIDTQKWLEKLGELHHAVKHHVDEEESNIFPKAKKILSEEEAKAIAVQMDELKEKMKAEGV